MGVMELKLYGHVKRISDDRLHVLSCVLGACPAACQPTVSEHRRTELICFF